jgi:hypothetical protein
VGLTQDICGRQRAEVWLLSEMEIGYYRRMGRLIIIIREWIQIIVIVREWGGDCCVGLGWYLYISTVAVWV